jgi:hypothetical protein
MQSKEEKSRSLGLWYLSLHVYGRAADDLIQLGTTSIGRSEVFKTCRSL